MVGIPDVGTGAAALQQEGVAVVEEVHTLCGKLVDGSHMAAQALLHLLLEEFGFLGHHHLGVLEQHSHGVVTTGPWVVQRSLVAAEIHLDALLGAILPEVHHIALVGVALGLLGGDGLVDGHEELVEVVVHLVDPALRVALLRSGGVNLGGDGDHTGNVASLGLCAAHATEAGGDEQLACRATSKLTGGVEHGDGGAVHDALRADVHIGAGSHLAILSDAEGVVALPVVGLAVVRYHHAVGDYHARSVLVAGIESHGMAAVHDEGLLVGHLAEVFHHQAVLSPVLEDGAVATVGDELVRMLSHGGVEVILDHQHDGGRLTALGRILLDGAGVHLVGGAQTVHIDAAVLLQLFGKLLGQHLVVLGGKIAQGVADGQLLLGRRQDILTLGSVVHRGVIGLGFGQRVGDTEAQFILEFFECHIFVIFVFPIKVL